MDGLLLINKEKNMTSRDVVNIASKKLNTKKIGHTGTLDPLATGVLVLALNKGLKIVEDITILDKEYIAEVTLGIKTDTLDITGNIIEEDKVPIIDEDNIRQVLNSFIGNYRMQVPIYSAVKVSGKKLYEYAREGKEVELPIKNVFVYNIELLGLSNNKFKFKCKVSKGTYIRSLINDICKKLNTIGVMSFLERTKQGKFDIKDTIKLDEIDENTKFISLEDAIDLPKIEVDDYLFNKIKNGSKLQNRYNYDKFAFIYNSKLIAIYIKDPKNLNKVKPKRVLI
ncbi:MAG: tRNA pseudouridine(55) synthase TruB [Bacilli bacterium]|nr:tRNA pseudouridine(55) synthase TruB [Bacilli bacterium]